MFEGQGHRSKFTATRKILLKWSIWPQVRSVSLYRGLCFFVGWQCSWLPGSLTPSLLKIF